MLALLRRYIENDAGEETPLLASDQTGKDLAHVVVVRVPDPIEDRTRVRRRNVVLLIFFITFTIEVGSGMVSPVYNSMIERLYCLRYHPDLRGVALADDARCKDPDVQASLARLRGWCSTVETIPSIICIIPYGMLSDKIGRQPILSFSWFGILLSIFWFQVVLFFPNVFAPWAILFEAAWIFIGGGSMVGVAMLFAALSDVVPASDLASVFFQLNAAMLSGVLIGAPVAGLLMTRSDWLALEVATVMFVLSFLGSLVLPETLKEPMHISSGLDDEAAPAQDPSSLARHFLGSFWANVKDLWKFVLGSPHVIALAVPIAFFMFGKFVQELLLQYTTERYGWTWSQAAYFLSILNISSLIMNIAVLPAASWLCVHRLLMSTMSKDLWLSRMSGVISVAGAVLIAFSSSGFILFFALVMLSVGGGFTALLRSLLNALVEPHHVGIANSLVSLLDSIGMMVAGPLFAEALKAGFEKGGTWVGLPFFCAAIFLTVATLFVCFFRIPKERRSA